MVAAEVHSAEVVDGESKSLQVPHLPKEFVPRTSIKKAVSSLIDDAWVCMDNATQQSNGAKDLCRSTRVRLQGLTGEELVLDTCAEDVLKLKMEVAARLRMPLYCIRILDGSENLKDCQQLSTYVQADSPDDDLQSVRLCYLISTKLEGDATERRATLMKLAKSCTNDPGDVSAIAVAALISGLSDHISALRQFAAECLSVDVFKGNECVVSALQEACLDDEEEVRRDAANALGKVAMEGDTDVIDSLTQLLRDRDRDVRLAAVEALGEVTQRQDNQTFLHISRRLSDSNRHVRRAAIETITKIVMRCQHGGHNSNEQQLVDLFCGQAHDFDPDVRIAVVSGLHDAGLMKYRKVGMKIVSMLGDEDCGVRVHVSQVLLRAVLDNDMKEAIREWMDSPNLLVSDNAQRLWKSLHTSQSKGSTGDAV